MDRSDTHRAGGAESCDNSNTATELLERLRSLGAPVARIKLTENRRTMISLGGPDRSTLRIHRRFLEAEATVLQAIARIFATRRGAGRAAAVRTIREFLVGQPVAPARVRHRSIRSSDRPHLDRLAAEFDRVNREFFDQTLPAVALYLSGRMRRRNGHFSSNPVEIVISRSLCVHAQPGEAEHTLRHEMIHLWQHHTSAALGHGAEFRRWARALDVHPRATRAVDWGPERLR